MAGKVGLYTTELLYRMLTGFVQREGGPRHAQRHQISATEFPDKYRLGQAPSSAQYCGRE